MRSLHLKCWRHALALAMCLLFLPPASADPISPKRAYPDFQGGVTGAWFHIEAGHVLRVHRVEPGTPADGRLKPGDTVLKINGLEVSGPDPRVPLGRAITQAEAGNGALRFEIDRGGKKGTVGFKIPRLGAYSETWPLGCDKSKQIIKAHAEWLAAQQTDGGWFDNRDRSHLTQCMAGLFLLSTGDQAYDDNVKRFAAALTQSALRGPARSTWHLGYHLIFLSEYYLKTGDRSVLPAIEAGCEIAAENQTAGAWGHHMNTTSVGYVQSGLMNSAGVTLFLGMTLARECGVTVHEEAFQRSLVFFYRMAGHGSIPYGDHRAEIYVDTNGRNAAIACAFGLLGKEPYTAAAEHLAMMVADSYYGFEAGHTGGGFNVLWRGIALPLLPEHQAHRAGRHMAELAWYYDLCRLPGGGMSMLPSPPDTKRYVGAQWGRGLGLTYTAPLKTLRITGAPRTEHSKKAPALDPEPWGTARDALFFGTDNAKGFGKEGLPHDVYAKLNTRERLPVEFTSKYIRHYNPFVRTTAAWKLGEVRSEAAYDAIERALKDNDPRVRRAACDAVSNYHHWSRRGGSSRLPAGVVSERFLPHIEKILADPRSAFWEVDGALWALAAAEPEGIRKNLKHINRFARHKEWYLRESAFWALVGLGGDMTGKEFVALADVFPRSRHVFERGSYDTGINYLVRTKKVADDPRVAAAFVRKIGSQLHESLLAIGYDEMAARHEAAHRIMMVLNRFPNPPYGLIAKDLAKYMDGWTPDYQHSAWLITGNNWQPGLAKIANQLGKDAGPIIKAFEHCLAQPYWNPRNKTHEQARAAMQQAVDTFKNR